MQEGLIKGTGNSRYLKSSIPAGTTWEQALAMLTAGTFPIDLNGINAAGWAVIADALNKANLLPDSVAAALGLAGNPQVKDALLAVAAVKPYVTGSYIGDNTSNRLIDLGFRPSAVIVFAEAPAWTGSSSSYSNMGFMIDGVPTYTSGGNFAGQIVSNGFSVSAYTNNQGLNSASDSVNPYRYIAFK